jgi:DNA-binding transcriptional regulator YiaG
MKLGELLQAWRGADFLGRGTFTQNEAAAFLGVPLRTYQEWEQGRCAPTGLALKTVLSLIKRKPNNRKD